MSTRWLFAPAMLAALFLAPVPAWGQWNPYGVPVCGDSCNPTLRRVVADGAGGVYVAWAEYNYYAGTSDDVYLQRLTGAGSLAPGWPTHGLSVCVLPNTQDPYVLGVDGSGGALVAWFDGRNVELGTNADIYAQRVLGDGTLASGWPVNGAPVTRALDAQYPSAVVPDGAGGAFVVWEDLRDWQSQASDVYAQYLTSNGMVAPSWPEDGLPVCTARGNQPYPDAVLPDGSGGMLVLWNDCRSDTCAIYGQHLLSDGTIAPGWTPNGSLLAPARLKPVVAPDGAGGFYMGSWSFLDGGYYVQRLTFDGTPWPGWPAGGVTVCAAPGGRDGLHTVPDGVGGVLLAWYDYRDPRGGSDIYATRVRPDGSLALGWTPDGTLLSDPDELTFDPDLASDGAGGAYVAWEWDTYDGRFSLVQHLTASGVVAPDWPQYGTRLAPSSHQVDPHPIEDGVGGAIVVWQGRGGPDGRYGVFAQRFAPDGPVAVLVSLATVQAEPERVVLTWQGTGAGALDATVHRRRAESGWERIGTPTADGPDRLRYEDRAITPGERYAYRLGYREGGVEQFTAETWVEVPHSLELELEGFQPNPAAGRVSVAFTLGNATAAVLELYDISGRRVFAREVGALGPGRHALRLEEGPLPPGVYLVRLTQGSRVHVVRGVVTR